MQHLIATALEPDTPPAISKTGTDGDGDPVQLWTFSNLNREARVIADWIAADIAASDHRVSRAGRVWWMWLWVGRRAGGRGDSPSGVRDSAGLGAGRASVDR